MRVVGIVMKAGASVMLCAALLVGLLSGTPAFAAGKATATETLNVRSGPATTYAVVGTIKAGQTVATLGDSNGWTTITLAGRTAYVSSQYLQAQAAAAAPTAVVSGSVRTTTAPLNVRKGGASSYAVLKVVAKGARVTMTGRTSAGFAELYAGPTKGWASLQYLRASSALPVVIGTRTTTAILDVRTTSGADAKTVAEVKKGSKVSITGVTTNGRAQIVHGNAARWVTAKYLTSGTASQPSAPGLPTITGTRYATATLLIRSTSADAYTTIAEVPPGTALSITGVVQNARMQIVYNKAVRWVTAQYLSTTNPAAPSTGSYAVEKGLTANAIKVHRASRAAFPQITTYYGVRQDAIPDHPSGRALDLMIPAYTSQSGKALGQEVAKWARANAKTLGIQYVIWNQQIWNVQRDKEGWRFMADRGGDSANHKNHVHITVYG
jgi:uncharacterized protein YgiM (DUF1202 family)